MYLQGMSSGDLAPALAEFFGTAAGLSASVITRLTVQWQAEQWAFAERDLADRDYVYTFATVRLRTKVSVVASSDDRLTRVR